MRSRHHNNYYWVLILMHFSLQFCVCSLASSRSILLPFFHFYCTYYSNSILDSKNVVLSRYFLWIFLQQLVPTPKQFTAWSQLYHVIRKCVAIWFWISQKSKLTHKSQSIVDSNRIMILQIMPARSIPQTIISL